MCLDDQHSMINRGIQDSSFLFQLEFYLETDL